MTSILAERQQALSEQIEREEYTLRALHSDLQDVDAALTELKPQREQIKLLGVVCDSLDQLKAMGSASLFWGDEVTDEEHDRNIARTRERVEAFGGKVVSLDSRRSALLTDIEQRRGNLSELHWHFDAVTEEMENARFDYVLEREPDDEKLFRVGVMPWSKPEDDQRRLRKALLVSLMFMLVIGGVPQIWEVPQRDPNEKVEIPERLARMVRERAPPKPVETPVERPQEQRQEEAKPEEQQVARERPEPRPEEVRQARERAQNRGVLAHSSLFADMEDDAMLSNLGANARISGDMREGGAQSSGAEGSRALITASTRGSGGAAALADVSRGGVGTGSGVAIGDRGVSTGRVQSDVAAIQQEARPLSDGVGPSRTDEEIQIVFDRHKSALYRLYNRELRNNPTLRGNIMLELTIQPDGSVSACRVVSSDLASDTLAESIVDRVSRFNFGPKEGVSAVTIRYPIDFLPAG
ncbi:AgmX/PglI C-terminal domain-containing protein [Isoalcanivorax indicus]|uniref:AgmX/PglI C-terminal domain-containing protein n=1 Tax=Isoalcanivorax indicus TaxID=2202653 RepID=UPI000DBAD328|nr:AgmX/PglI C-terminal domain-containing protein [Isoalcanivorax indicus]